MALILSVAVPRERFPLTREKYGGDLMERCNESALVKDNEAKEILFNEPRLVLQDSRHSQIEARFHAFGETEDERWLHLTFTLRQNGTLIRVISARDMHRKERAVYEQTKKSA